MLDLISGRDYHQGMLLRTLTKKISRFFELLLFLPFVVVHEGLTQQKKLIPRIGIVFLSFFVLLPLWAGFYYLIGAVGSQIVQLELRQIGMIQDDILIAGTGSMYPTFPKGTGDTDIAKFTEIVADAKMRVYPSGIRIFGRTFSSYQLQVGDIISFSNEKTRSISATKYGEEAGMVKRLIGLPGDTIEIRDGFVLRNEKLMEEPYTPRARVTYGGAFLSDCQVLKIPDGFVFVLGDNRIASNDSRHDIGLVAIADIDHVLPKDEQGIFSSRFRDASDDHVLQNTPTLNTAEYVDLLNERRRNAGVAELVFDSQLSKSAALRAQIILDTNDTSFAATKSGYSIKLSMKDAGYFNPLFGESPVIGFLNAGEVLENSFEFPQSREFLLNEDYDDVGIAAVVGEINGCPAQVIVQQFGGYIPPNYSSDEISSWKELVSNLNTVIPTWEDLRESGGFYESHKESVERLLTLLNRRREIARGIEQKVSGNQWLTDADYVLIEEDKKIAEEANKLIEELNDQ